MVVPRKFAPNDPPPKFEANRPNSVDDRLSARSGGKSPLMTSKMETRSSIVARVPSDHQPKLKKIDQTVCTVGCPLRVVGNTNSALVI